MKQNALFILLHLLLGCGTFISHITLQDTSSLGLEAGLEMLELWVRRPWGWIKSTRKIGGQRVRHEKRSWITIPFWTRHRVFSSGFCDSSPSALDDGNFEVYVCFSIIWIEPVCDLCEQIKHEKSDNVAVPTWNLKKLVAIVQGIRERAVRSLRYKAQGKRECLGKHLCQG